MIARFKVPINDEEYSINWRQKIIDCNTRDRARNLCKTWNTVSHQDNRFNTIGTDMDPL